MGWLSWKPFAKEQTPDQTATEKKTSQSGVKFLSAFTHRTIHVLRLHAHQQKKGSVLHFSGSGLRVTDPEDADRDSRRSYVSHNFHVSPSAHTHSLPLSLSLFHLIIPVIKAQYVNHHSSVCVFVAHIGSLKPKPKHFAAVPKRNVQQPPPPSSSLTIVGTGTVDWDEACWKLSQ